MTKQSTDWQVLNKLAPGHGLVAAKKSSTSVTAKGVFKIFGGQ